MSTLNSQTDWTNIRMETLNSKYEKCRNITEEIYKRINITFQVNKLQTSEPQIDVSDESDQIDSNELSNETDLFACDKSSLSSSTELENLELGSAACEKYININNNEETKVKRTPVVSKRPKKRFRKRIKKQLKQAKHSDGSSDEAPAREGDGVDLNYKMKPPPLQKDKMVKKQDVKMLHGESTNIDNSETSDLSVKQVGRENRVCELCSFRCNDENGLRHHMNIAHTEYLKGETSTNLQRIFL